MKPSLTLLTAVTVVLSTLCLVADAQQSNDALRTEITNLDNFLDTHPQVRDELNKNPGLVNDPAYLQKHPDLYAFLQSHPGVRDQLRSDASGFLQRERAYNQGQARLREPQPYMEAALSHLRQAESWLTRSARDKGGHRMKAIGLVRQAEAEVQAGIDYANTH